MSGVSCPIADLIVEVQTAARAPFVSLFQVFTTEEKEHWNKSEGALEAQFVDTHECDPSQPAGTSPNKKLLEKYVCSIL